MFHRFFWHCLSPHNLVQKDLWFNHFLTKTYLSPPYHSTATAIMLKYFNNKPTTLLLFCSWFQTIVLVSDKTTLLMKVWSWDGAHKSLTQGTIRDWPSFKENKVMSKPSHSHTSKGTSTQGNNRAVLINILAWPTHWLPGTSIRPIRLNTG